MYYDPSLNPSQDGILLISTIWSFTNQPILIHTWSSCKEDICRGLYPTSYIALPTSYVPPTSDARRTTYLSNSRLDELQWRALHKIIKRCSGCCQISYSIPSILAVQGISVNEYLHIAQGVYKTFSWLVSVELN